MNLQAPVILFVYNRPWHTQQMLDALRANTGIAETDIFVFADGPKKEATPDDQKAIQEVRGLCEAIDWAKSVTLTTQPNNVGLANHVIFGINTVFKTHDSVIVLEDDLLTSPGFLTYCNEGLELYKDDAHVYAINGFQFPIDFDQTSTFLCPLATSSWGWATWKRAWSCFQEEASHTTLLQNHKHLSRRFNFADYDYVNMLDNPNSWAIRWYYSVFLRNGLGVFPTRSLVENIGLDSSGTHGGTIEGKQERLNITIAHKKQQEIDLIKYAKMLDYFSEDNDINRRIKRVSLIEKVFNRMSKR